MRDGKKRARSLGEVSDHKATQTLSKREMKRRLLVDPRLLGSLREIQQDYQGILKPNMVIAGIPYFPEMPYLSTLSCSVTGWTEQWEAWPRPNRAMKFRSQQLGHHFLPFLIMGTPQAAFLRLPKRVYAKLCSKCHIWSFKKGHSL